MTGAVWRRETHDEMPWRNGGGTTLEVARAPRDGAADDFDWRVSFARVDGDGPFSSFPGVDRVITLVDGGHMLLAVAAGGRCTRHDLEPFVPFAFAGEAEVAAYVDAPTLDLNVMTCRDRCVARVACHEVGDAPLTLVPDDDVLLVACLRGKVRVTGVGGDFELRPLDVAALDHPATLIGRAVVAVVHLSPKAG